MQKITFGESSPPSLYRMSLDLDIHIGTLSHYKHGKTVPTLARARQIARYLNTTLDNLYFRGEDII